MSNDKNASTKDNSNGGKGSKPSELEVSEQRRKDAQAALTPLQQELARVKAELAAAKSPTEPTITPERQQELDDMKFTKPDEWHKQMKEIESDEKVVKDKELDRLTKIETDKVQAQSFFEANPSLDKDVIKQIIPNAIQKRYEDGELTIGEVLNIGKKLLDGAPIASILAPDSPKIGDVAGSDKPTDSAKKKQVEQDWATVQI